MGSGSVSQTVSNNISLESGERFIIYHLVKVLRVCRNQLIEQETGAGAGAGERLENWTKWPLHLLQHTGQGLVVQPSTQLDIANMVITCPSLPSQSTSCLFPPSFWYREYFSPRFPH